MAYLSIYAIVYATLGINRCISIGPSKNITRCPDEGEGKTISIGCDHGRAILIHHAYTSTECSVPEKYYSTYDVKNIWTQCNLGKSCSVEMTSYYLRVVYTCVLLSEILRVDLCSDTHVNGNEIFLTSPGYPRPPRVENTTCRCSAKLDQPTKVTLHLLYQDGFVIRTSLYVDWDENTKLYPERHTRPINPDKNMEIFFTPNETNTGNRFWMRINAVPALDLQCTSPSVALTSVGKSVALTSVDFTITLICLGVTLIIIIIIIIPILVTKRLTKKRQATENRERSQDFTGNGKKISCAEHRPFTNAEKMTPTLHDSAPFKRDQSKIRARDQYAICADLTNGVSFSACKGHQSDEGGGTKENDLYQSTDFGGKQITQKNGIDQSCDDNQMNVEAIYEDADDDLCFGEGLEGHNLSRSNTKDTDLDQPTNVYQMECIMKDNEIYAGASDSDGIMNNENVGIYCLADAANFPEFNQMKENDLYQSIEAQ